MCVIRGPILIHFPGLVQRELCQGESRKNHKGQIPKHECRHSYLFHSRPPAWTDTGSYDSSNERCEKVTIKLCSRPSALEDGPIKKRELHRGRRFTGFFFLATLLSKYTHFKSAPRQQHATPTLHILHESLLPTADVGQDGILLPTDKYSCSHPICWQNLHCQAKAFT